MYFSIKTCWLGSVGFSPASSMHQALMWEVLGKQHIACGVWQSGWCSVHADELRLWGSCSRYAVTSTVAVLADWRCMQIKHLPKWKRNVYYVLFYCDSKFVRVCDIFAEMSILMILFGCHDDRKCPQNMNGVLQNKSSVTVLRLK